MALVTAALSCAAFTATAHAQAIDPVNDFLPTYTGVKGTDLDVVSTRGTFDGSTFTLTTQLAGPLGATPGAAYVFGFDRGAGTVRFPTLADQVVFDSVLNALPNGTGTLNLLNGSPAFVLPPGAVQIFGSLLIVSVNVANLPSLGFAPADYTFNLWPRSGAGNALISDFAPDNSNARFVAVPEPATYGAFAVGALLFAAVRRRRSPKLSVKS